MFWTFWSLKAEVRTYKVVKSLKYVFIRKLQYIANLLRMQFMTLILPSMIYNYIIKYIIELLD